MIYIYRASREIGVALFDLDTGKFVYGEICKEPRLVSFINNFPQHEVVIYVESAFRDDLDQLYFLMPYLKDFAEVRLVPSIDVRKSLASVMGVARKPAHTLINIVTGVILGLLLLIPTVDEYKGSVMTKALAVESFTQNFAQSQPAMQTLEQLYKSINNLYSIVRVEAISYNDGKYKIVFSSANKELKLRDLPGFDDAELKNVSTLVDEINVSITIYELEGEL